MWVKELIRLVILMLDQTWADSWGPSAAFDAMSPPPRLSRVRGNKFFVNCADVDAVVHRLFIGCHESTYCASSATSRSA
jgi:hypothetical protein